MHSDPTYLYKDTCSFQVVTKIHFVNPNLSDCHDSHGVTFTNTYHD